MTPVCAYVIVDIDINIHRKFDRHLAVAKRGSEALVLALVFLNSTMYQQIVTVTGKTVPSQLFHYRAAIKW